MFECRGSSRRDGCAAQLAAILLLGLMTSPVIAQSSSPEGIGEVTLFGDDDLTIQAATKTEIPLSKAPGPVSVVTARQIRESGARTIPEALRLVAGVNVRWNPMVQSIDIRSFGQNPFTSRVLLLIDGVPYNSWNKGGFPQHPGFDFFSLQNIKRLEVVRGAGSALYGENAYWGVINIVTLSGEDFEGTRVQLGGGDLESRTLGVTWGRSLGEDSSILVSGRLANGQLGTSFWFEDNDAEVEAQDFYVKAKIKDFELSYYRYQDEADGFEDPAAIPGFPPGSAFRSPDVVDQDVDIFALKYERKFSGDRYSVSGDISFAQRDGSHCGSCHALPEDPEEFGSSADHGSQWIGDLRFGVHAIPGHDLLFGIEARRLDSGGHDDELGTLPGGAEPVLAYDKVAAYVQDQISFLDDRLQVTLGLRYDGSNDLFDDEFSPRAAVVWEATDRLILRAGWGQAFRFPNFSELYQDSWLFNIDAGSFAVPFSIFLPNPGLEPESIETFDLGAQFRLSSQWSAKLDFFYSEVEDFMVLGFFQPPPGSGPGTMQVVNHPDTAEIYGSEFEIRWTSSSQRINGFFNWAWQDQEQGGDLLDAVGKPLEFVYAPENKINLGAYFGPFSGLSGSVEVMWKDDVYGPSFWNLVVSGFTDPNLAELEGATFVNVRLSYDLPVVWSRGGQASRISVYGKNLLDEEPIETLVGVGSEVAGRTVYGMLELRF